MRKMRKIKKMIDIKEVDREREVNKFDTNKDASNKCEDERIFWNLMKFT